MALTRRMRLVALAHALVGRWLENHTGERNPEFVLVVPNVLPGQAPAALGSGNIQKDKALLLDAVHQLERMEARQSLISTRLH